LAFNFNDAFFALLSPQCSFPMVNIADFFLHTVPLSKRVHVFSDGIKSGPRELFCWWFLPSSYIWWFINLQQLKMRGRTYSRLWFWPKGMRPLFLERTPLLLMVRVFVVANFVSVLEPHLFLLVVMVSVS
jgi:hypothetical protein